MVANLKEIDPDDARLRAQGFDPRAPAAQALATLRELRGKPGVSAAAIARALGNLADAGAGEMLSAMEPNASGALRREIRRSIYKLRRRGIAVPEAAPDRVVAVPSAPAAPGVTALMSPIDQDGAQIIWMMKERAQGGLMRLWGLLSESDGLAGAQVLALNRRELRAQREELEQQAKVKLVEIEPALADFILCDAYRRTPESRRALVGNFYTLRTEIMSGPPPAEIAHPIYSELAEKAAGEPSADLMKEPEITELRFSPEQLKPYLEEVNRAQESVLVVSRASQEERISGAVDRAIEGLLSGAKAQRIRRRLEDTALYLLKTGRPEAAGWAGAAAAKIRDGADLKRVAFFRTLVQTQLAALMAQEKERKQDEPRLIVTPAEAIRAQQERQTRMRGPRR